MSKKEVEAIFTAEAADNKEKRADAGKSPESIDKRAEDIPGIIQEFVSGGKTRVENAGRALGLEGRISEDIKNRLGIDAGLGELWAKAEKTGQTALQKLSEAGLAINGKKERVFPGTRLKTEYPPEKLRALRDPAVVGKEKYGAGLVNTFQKEGLTTPAQEMAQEAAIRALEEKIKAGLVDPEAIGADMIAQLEVSPDLRDAPDETDQVLGIIHAEVDGFVDKEFIIKEEAHLIKEEAEKFLRAYQEAFPEASPQKVFEIVRDNCRKVAYQTKMDKLVFSGSDHGTRHILEGNMKFADQMVQSLAEKGVAISALDRVLIRQVIIDHDCGYTCGCAQAKQGFEASKDHPVFSAKFIEANQAYYEDKFGKEAFGVIRNAVLYHSYPVAEYQTGPEGASQINERVIRSITSTVDSLGVTAETKTPAFFRKPEAIKTLLKVKLALEFSETKNKKGDAVLPETDMARYKQELLSIASADPNKVRREGFGRAIGDFFNEFTAETSLGHYTGVVEHVGVETGPDGKLVPKIDMHLSRIHALLGDLFGGKLETQAFSKAMKDFGIGQIQLKKFGSALETARRGGEKPSEALRFSSDRAIFEIAPQFAEDAADEFSDIREVVAEVYNVSIRMEINSLLSEIESSADATEKIPEIQAKFEASVTGKTTADELKMLLELTEQLADATETEKVDADGRPITKSREATAKLRRFQTEKEHSFLGL